tara:strand:- start:734 stop:1861 length:1128 start_codon:yes stop_codon:yes gene_type:complete
MAIGLGSIAEIINTQLAKNQVAGMSSLVTITERLVERLNDQKADQAVDFESNADYRRARRRSLRLQAFKDKISDNVSAATKAKNAASFIEVHLDSMKSDLEALLGSTSDEDRAAAATDFDELYNNINSRANGANQLVNYQNVNLIGNTHGPDWNTDTIYTPTNKTGGFTTIEGAYLGTEHEIIDADGYAWRYDKGNNIYKQFYNDGTNVATGLEYTATDMTVQSIDHSDDSVTLSNGTDTITGTLNRGGLGVLNSEYYSSFADDTAVQEAIDDIDAAIIYFDTNSTRLTANTSLLQGNVYMIREEISLLEKEIADIVTVEIQENGARNRAANLKFTLAINNINLVSQNNMGLIQNMLELASPQEKAQGLFGMLGY